MKRVIMLLVVILFPCFQVASAQQRNMPGEGYQVDARLEVGPSKSVKGELIAVGSDSLWVRSDRNMTAMALGDLDRVRVQQHSFTFGKAMLIALLGGLVTGGAMTAACSSVASDCGSVFVGMMTSWLVVGAVAGATSSGSAYRNLEPMSYETLQPYARYPQGVPPGVDLDSETVDSMVGKGTGLSEDP